MYCTFKKTKPNKKKWRWWCRFFSDGCRRPTQKTKKCKKVTLKQSKASLTKKKQTNKVKLDDHTTSFPLILFIFSLIFFKKEAQVVLSAANRAPLSGILSNRLSRGAPFRHFYVVFWRGEVQLHLFATLWIRQCPCSSIIFQNLQNKFKKFKRKWNIIETILFF